MFYVGQKVKMVDDTDWGKILKIEDGRILVLTSHGFENYYNINELVPDTNPAHIPLNLNSAEARQKMMDEKAKIANSNDTQKGNYPEIDLHIENLLDNWQKMSNYDILQYQLRYLKKRLDVLMEKKTPKIIIIHGKGEGVLRNEIRLELMKYPNIEFFDGSYLEYGIGATEIRIRYNY